MRLILDIETTTDHNKIWCAVTNNIDTGEITCHTEAVTLRSQLERAELLIGHNILSFDAFHLNRLWKTKITLTQCIDTLVLSRLLNPSLDGGHSLAAWGQRLNCAKIDFTDYNLEHSTFEELVNYCIQDTELTKKLYLELNFQLENQGFSEESIKLEHEVQAIIAKQERTGFKLNIPFAMTLLAELKQKMSTIEEEMQSIFPPIVTERYSEKTGKRLKDNVEVFNVGSRQQIAKRLSSLGWKPKVFTEKGQAKVDETVLAGIKIPEAQPIAQYLMLQKRASQVSSWLDAVDVHTGRVNGRVITNGAVTGRMTHHSPNMAQVPSLQKHPDTGEILYGILGGYGAECRQCWTVPDGYVVVGCDASGLELRMLAHYMQDSNYTQVVVYGSSKNGTDIHTVNMRAAGLATRAQAKTFIYAFLYGAGPAKIGKIIEGTAKDGQKLIEKFLRNTPALQKLRAKVEKFAKKGYMPGLDGRKIWVRSEHAALNTLLQGAGAIIMKKALCLLNQKIMANKWDAKFVVNVHDEFQLEVKEDIAKEVGEAAKQSIKEAGEYYKLRCPLDGDYAIGKNWAETH